MKANPYILLNEEVFEILIYLDTNKTIMNKSFYVANIKTENLKNAISSAYFFIW